MLVEGNKIGGRIMGLMGFLFLALTLFAVSFAPLAVAVAMAVAATFPDVPVNTVHYAAVEYLKAKNVIAGYPDATFKPDKMINRAEALKIVMLASASPLESQTELVFPDVPASEWFYGYVRKGFELKIVEGYQDGFFKPENGINVAESLKIVMLAFKATASESPLVNPYPDVDRLFWYAPYVEYSRVRQLIWPQGDGKLHAERSITRGEFAQILYRFMYIGENKLNTFPLSTNWPTYTHPTDHYLLKYPFDWLKLNADKQVIFWKRDEENKQVSFARVFPNGATVLVAVDANESRLSPGNYVDLLHYDKEAKVQKLTLNGYPFASVTVEATGITDYFFELPNKTMLVVYTQTGSGLYKTHLLEEIRYLVGSIRYNEGTTSGVSARDLFLSEVRGNILVEGQGQLVLDLFKDEVLIETDTIGIGTGPIDYYYSTAYDVTLKYERVARTLLALSDGKNTAF